MHGVAQLSAVRHRAVDLTQNEAMVLVSIAYHQPVTRAGVSEILGREVSRDVIGALRDKNMITAGPRSPTAGAPFTYVTTKGFLEHFGLDTLRDLPDMEGLEEAGLVSTTIRRNGLATDEENVDYLHDRD